jgi:hypothetical protein
MKLTNVICVFLFELTRSRCRPCGKIFVEADEKFSAQMSLNVTGWRSGRSQADRVAPKKVRSKRKRHGKPWRKGALVGSSAGHAGR